MNKILLLLPALVVASPAVAFPAWMTLFSAPSEWYGREVFQVDTNSVTKRYGYTYAKGRWNKGETETIAVQCSSKRIMFDTERTFPEPYWNQLVDGKWLINSDYENPDPQLRIINQRVMDFLCETGSH